MKYEQLKTIAIDIQHSVFENETAAIMYVTKDIFSDRYIITIPAFTFGFDIDEEFYEREYEWLKNSFPHSNSTHKEKLIREIKKAIAALGGKPISEQELWEWEREEL